MGIAMEMIKTTKIKEKLTLTWGDTFLPRGCGT
jgi:hypothetical protein